LDLGGGRSGTGSEPVKISTEWSANGVEPGGQVVLAVVVDIKDGWHIQVARPPKPSSVATQVNFEGLPTGVTTGDQQWPKEHKLKVDLGDGPELLPFYTGKAVIFQKLAAPSGIAAGEHPFTTVVEWQACDDQSCLMPKTTKLSTVLHVVPAGTGVEPRNVDLFRAYSGNSAAATVTFDIFGWTIPVAESSFVLLLLMAALGGFLLNLTPCVLPLIPIKVMGLARAAGNRSRCFLLGTVMSLGVVTFWLALGASIAFVADFKATNQLFQMPWFTIAIGVVIAVMAVGMMGLFSVRLPQSVYAFNPTQETLHGSFLFGVMTAVLSTPCTAPFMGAAAAWAAKQEPGVTLVTFSSIGTGMAVPYLVLAAFPALAHSMPRAGSAGDLIKQVMGLLLLAAAAYFLGTGIAGKVVEPPDPPPLAYWWAVGSCIAVAGLWLAWRTFRITTASGKRVVFAAVGVLLVAAGVFLAVRFTDRGPVRWLYYTTDREAAALREGKVVVLDFTAQWCLNCQALEQTVLHSDRVVVLLNDDRVSPIKVDLTGNNTAGNERLRETGRLTIPLLIVLDPKGREVFKSDAYTVQQVVSAISQAGLASASR
jgi:thiol:disulfide interchange protein DsbD